MILNATKLTELILQKKDWFLLERAYTCYYTLPLIYIQKSREKRLH